MKLTPKHIMFILMCTLLVLTIVLGCIVLSKVSGLLQLGGAGTPAPSESSTVNSTPVPSTSEAPPPSSSEQETTAPHVHEFVKYKTVSAACDTQGYSMYSCECGKNDIRDFVDPLGHNYGEEKVVAPTCDTAGWTERTCSRCKRIEKTNTVPAGHSFGDWTEGLTNKQRTCGGCHITEICSLDETQTWVLRIFAQEVKDGFAYQKVTVDLDGKDNDFTCELYISAELSGVEFDCTDAGLTISYTLAGEPQNCVVSAGTMVLTIYADGTTETAVPTVTPDPVPDPEPEPDPEPDPDPEPGADPAPEGNE